MTPEEQRFVAIECGADERIITGYGMTYEFNATELAAYTAAVEAKERMRISDWIRHQRNDIPATGEEFADAIIKLALQ